MKTANPPPYSNSLGLPDDLFWGLQGYDVVYVVDDSSSMSWVEQVSKITPWPEARKALKTFSTICAEWDDDGQDLFFINNKNTIFGASPEEIDAAFASNKPHGGTNMGRALMRVVEGYFDDYKTKKPKPLNILAITDGVFTDDVASVIKWIVDQMDKVNALPNQVGIQFIQIGADPAATKALEHLDDDLISEGVSKDIVDTVPWYADKVDGRKFDGTYLAKVVCGAINRKLDHCDYSRGRAGNASKSQDYETVHTVHTVQTVRTMKKKGFLRRVIGM